MHPDHELAQSMAQANSDASAAASSGSHYTSGTQNVRDNSFANSTNSNYRPSWSQLQFNSNSSLNFNHQPTDVSYHQQQQMSHSPTANDLFESAMRMHQVQ